MECLMAHKKFLSLSLEVGRHGGCSDKVRALVTYLVQKLQFARLKLEKHTKLHSLKPWGTFLHDTILQLQI